MSLRRICILALAIFPSVAQAAAHSVTIVGISGPGGDRFSDSLVDELFEIYEIVPGTRYRDTAIRLGKRGASPEEVQSVAAAIHVDAVIGGAVVGQGRERRLLIAIRDGLTGRVVARGNYDLGSTNLPLIRERVLRDVVRALEHCGPRAGGEAETPPPNEEPPPPELQGTNELAVEKSATPPPPSMGVFAGVGVSLLTRSLTFDVASAPSFKAGTVAGVRADGAVFPLALSSELAQAHPVLASFGLVGSYEHIFTFTANGPGGSSKGSASHWMALLVGRIPLGHKASGGTLQIETGYQELGWQHQSQQDTRIPDVDYQSIDIGLQWDRALGAKWIVGALRVAYLAVFDAGKITGPDQYGNGNGWGVEAQASVTAWPVKWVWLKLEARYDAMGLSFARDGTRFAKTSLDQWTAGVLEVGFAL
jgi:hypothetical protein